MVPNQNMEGDQPVQSHSHTQQPLQPQTCVQEHCPGETGIPNVSFPGCLRNVSSTSFHSPELHIQCGFIWKDTMQLASGKVEFNACQVSLLWHNSFLAYKLFSPPSYNYPLNTIWNCYIYTNFTSTLACLGFGQLHNLKTHSSLQQCPWGLEILFVISGILLIYQKSTIYRVSPKKAERSIFVTLILKNIAYLDFIR